GWLSSQPLRNDRPTWRVLAHGRRYREPVARTRPEVQRIAVHQPCDVRFAVAIEITRRRELPRRSTRVLTVVGQHSGPVHKPPAQTRRRWIVDEQVIVSVTVHVATTHDRPPSSIPGNETRRKSAPVAGPEVHIV